ncbi:MAG: HAMP domain-containing sensor histidine kinase [Saprospiraceae bacterium]
MRIVSYAVMFYMSFALIWWSVLLTKNNKDLYKVKVEQLDISDTNYQTKLNQLKTYHDRKAKMILGEGLVFGFMLIIGLYVIQRMFNRQLDNIQRQKNFLLSITHELKSPIASVNLITETLQKRELDKTTQNELLANILLESKRLEKLINNLLLSAKLQSYYKYNFEWVNLSSILEDQIQRLKRNHKNVTITTDFPNHIEAKIDQESFTSVISNLLENGIKYSEKDPVLDIIAKSEGEMLSISVKDRGIGISNMDKKKIFDQFFRVGNEENRSTKGTGLGLYIAYKIVKAHKGKIEVSDNFPNGSIFTVQLPA